MFTEIFQSTILVNVLLSWKDCVLWKDSNIIGTDNNYDIFSGLQIMFGGSWMFRKQYCETRIRGRDKLLWKVLEFYLVLILVKFWCNTFLQKLKGFHHIFFRNFDLCRIFWCLRNIIFIDKHCTSSKLLIIARFS